MSCARSGRSEFCPGSSRTGTLTSWPRCAGGWAFTIACRVELSIASTNPSPSTLCVLRMAITLTRDGITRSWCLMYSARVREWMREPPGWSVHTPFCHIPARVSVIWLVAPKTGLAMWHSPQPRALKTGPSPSSSPSGPANSPTAASMLHSSGGTAGDRSDTLARSAWRAQNSARNPLSLPSYPVGASVACAARAAWAAWVADAPSAPAATWAACRLAWFATD